MEYVPPLNGAGDDPYVNPNPGAGVKGSAVPAEALEHPQREIIEVIIDAGMVPDGGDLTQLSQAIQALIAAGSSVPALLAAIAAAAGNGFIVKTGSTTAATRSLQGTANQIVIADGSGVAGDPAFTLSVTLVAPGTLATVGAMTAGAGLTVNGGDADVSAGHLAATRNGQLAYDTAALKARSTSGNVIVALEAATASAAAIKHTRGGNGIQVLDAAGVDADIKGRDLVASGKFQGVNVAKAWVTFDGTALPTLNAGHNVSSVSSSVAGTYTINFVTPMADANYVCVGFARSGDSDGNALVSARDSDAKTASAMTVKTVGTNSTAAGHKPEVSVVFFGN